MPTRKTRPESRTPIRASFDYTRQRSERSRIGEGEIERTTGTMGRE